MGPDSPRKSLNGGLSEESHGFGFAAYAEYVDEVTAAAVIITAIPIATTSVMAYFDDPFIKLKSYQQNR